MIVELAEIRIRTGTDAEFEKAISRAIADILSQAQGFEGVELRRSIEDPDRYVLLVSWHSVDCHMVLFRGSPVYADWRGAISPYFAEPPRLEHLETVAIGS